jgi:HD-GYP domain-containing protein (c-di-GMP phosphodiesterase class II)
MQALSNHAIGSRNGEDTGAFTVVSLVRIADAVDLRDPIAGGHSRRVAQWCASLLREMHIDGEEAELIITAARLHDIGKIAIPDSILRKPSGLTVEEFGIMKGHVVRGSEFLENEHEASRGMAIVLHHHERWDGAGYPHGLKGLAIPFGARLVAVADSLDAMTADRTYHKGMTVVEATSVIRNGSGAQWDPEIVDALLSLIGREPDELLPLPQRFENWPFYPEYLPD